MDRLTLALMFSCSAFVMFVLGWTACWLWLRRRQMSRNRLNRQESESTPPEPLIAPHVKTAKGIGSRFDDPLAEDDATEDNR
ncbi:MAG: hypothetical protein OXE84_04120 [Rhodobacteraceae bacterium]|nr:hypothetical protein [Paracoccaceae bacterium]MCY4196500.1 hypothetical protein [Paracoccaceae bacterium]